MKNSGQFKKRQRPSPKTEFKKGQFPWNTGKKWSEANRKKMSESHKDRTAWNKGIKGSTGGGRPKGGTPWNKGLKLPQLSGVNHHNFGKNFLWTDEMKQQLKTKRDFRKEKHPNWISDRNLLVKSERHHLDGRYRDWMLAVKNRDEWKCKIKNSDCKGRLESHHILNWKEFPELRYELENGITLCQAHHPKGRRKEAELSKFFQELVAKM